MKKRVQIVILLLLSVTTFAQNKNIEIDYLIDSIPFDELSEEDKELLDSCLSLYTKETKPLHKIKALSGICDHMSHDIWEEYQHIQLQMLEQELKNNKQNHDSHELKKLLAGALNNIGYVETEKGNIETGLANYKRSLKLSTETNNNEGQAMTLNNIGYVFELKGDIPRALEYYHKALKIQEQIADTSGVALSFINIGMIYDEQEDYDNALNYYQKSLELRQAINEQEGIANCLNNMGIIYRQQNNYPKALDYYNRSLKIRESIDDHGGIAISLNNIGVIYQRLKNYPKAIEFYNKSLQIEQELMNTSGIITSLNNIAFTELERNNYVKARESGQKAFDLAIETGFPNEILDPAKLLYQVNKKENKNQKSLEMFEIYIQMRDSLNNEKTQKAAIRQQTKYEFEKEQLIKQQQKKEAIRVEEEKTQRRNNLQYSIILVAILLVFGTLLSLGKISVSIKFAEGLIFFAFLIFFEFLLVLSDPYVDNLTAGAPAYKLIANALLAAVIFPVHAFFEKVLKNRIIEKDATNQT